MSQMLFNLEEATDTNRPALPDFRWIVVNSSGGKDSQTCLRNVVRECDRLGVPRKRIVVSHQDLGEMEWPGTRELVERQAACYGLSVRISRYRDRTGGEPSLLDYVRRRGMWPSSQQRYCTSEFKRGPGGRVLTELHRLAPGRILNVYGFRAEESPARARRHTFVRNQRFSSTARDVWDWLPIHEWSDAQVWADIRASGVPYHPAYDLGMPRLSCCFCIFAPRSALLVSARANPALLDRYCQVEEDIGHTFQNGCSLQEIRHAVQTGEQPAELHGSWNM